MRILVLAALMLLGLMLPARADTPPRVSNCRQMSMHCCHFWPILGFNNGLRPTEPRLRRNPRHAPTKPPAPSHPLADYVSAIRATSHGFARALPTLPGQFAKAWSVLVTDVEEVSPAGLIGLFGAFAAVGFGAAWLYRRTSSGFEARVAHMSRTTRRGQLIALGSRFILQSWARRDHRRGWHRHLRCPGLLARRRREDRACLSARIRHRVVRPCFAAVSFVATGH